MNAASTLNLGLDANTTGKAGGLPLSVPLGDLASIIVSYDATNKPGVDVFPNRICTRSCRLRYRTSLEMYLITFVFSLLRRVRVTRSIIYKTECLGSSL